MMFLFTIILAVVLAEAELDIVVPSLPELQAFLGVSVFQTELLLTANLISHGIAALFVGHLADIYGKKKILLWSLFLFIFGSSFLVFLDDFYMLLLGRVLQGAGAAGPMVIGYVLAVEQASKTSRANVMGLLNGTANTALALTPSIGSIGTLYLGWRGNFTILFAIGFLALALAYFFIPADQKEANNALESDKSSGESFIGSYISLLKDSRFFLYLLSTSLIPSGWFVFVGTASIVYINGMGLSLGVYAIHQGVVAFTFALFSFLSGRIIAKLGVGRATKASIFFLVMGFLVGMLIVMLVPGAALNPVFVTAAMAITAIGAVIPINLTHILTIEFDSAKSGKISALITMVRWFIASIGIQTASWFYQGSFVSTAYVLITLFLLSVAVAVWLIKNDAKFKAQLFGSDKS